ncbi:MAG: PQQ-binding-like beta-propeller repeat protein [Myxococcota bacterium]
MTNLFVLPLCIAVFSSSAERESLTLPNPESTRIDAASQVVFGLRWRLPVVRMGQFRQVIDSFGTPAISNRRNVLIVAQGEGSVLALSTHTGDTVWRYEHKAPFEATVSLIDVVNQESGLLDELAVVAGRDGALLALNVDDGSLRWTADIEGETRSVASQNEELLFVTTARNKVYAIDKKNGTVKWSQGRSPSAGLTILGHSRPTLHRGILYVTYADGYAESYNADSGETLWSRPLTFGASEFADADADPVALDDRVFVASYADGVYALDAKDGKTLWTQPAPAVIALASHNDLLIAASADGWIWGMEQTSGIVRYRVRMPTGASSSLQVRQGLGVLSTGRSGLLVFAADNGKPLQLTALVGRSLSAPAWVGKDLAMLAADGHIYMFGLGSPGLVN